MKFPASSPSRKADLPKVWALIQEKRYLEARDLCIKVCKASKRDAEPWLLMGTINGWLGHFADAAENFRKALSINPNSAEGHYSIAVALHKQALHDQAQTHYRNAIALRSDYVEAHYNLAMSLLESGLHTEALMAFQQVITLRPKMAEGYCGFGNVMLAMGNPGLALDNYEQALRLDPRNIQAHVSMALAYQAKGQLAEAHGALQKAVTFEPRFAEGHFRLGYLLQQQGLHEESLACYRQALSLRGDYAEAHYNLAMALDALQRPQEAMASLKAAIASRPDYADAYYNLANLYMQGGALDDAVSMFRRVIEIAPGHASAHFNLANVLQNQGHHADAVAEFKEAIRCKPDYPEAYVNLANAQMTTNSLDDAMASCRMALRLRPGYDCAIAGMANVLERRGQFVEAYDLIRPMIEGGMVGSRMALVLAALARPLGLSGQAITLLHRVINEGAPEPFDLIDLHYALGKLYDSAKDYDSAFLHYQNANVHYRKLFAGVLDGYDPRNDAEITNKLIEVYSERFMRECPRSALKSDRPVFVVGMPRSGTTLTEQILASHPAVHGAGELIDIANVVTALPEMLGGVPYPQCMLSATSEVLDLMAQKYLDRISEKSATALRVVDKMPHNFLQLGLISRLFPGARVIHIMRNPVDTCLSIYFQKFNTRHAYARDLAHLGAYYREYERLMAHWRNVLDIPMLDVQYEELVSDQEQVTRKMIDFCGLDWDPACLHFHATKRDVMTPSYDQVRQPIYSKSAGRWKCYERHLVPLIAALEEPLGT